HEHPPLYHLKLGILFILLAWLFFTLMATLSRFATATLSLSTVIFFQNFIGLLGVIPWIFHHGSSSLKTDRFGLILVRALTGLLSFIFLFMAVERTSLVDAILLNNAAPILIPFVTWIWLKIPINHKLWPGIIAGFLGIILILKPGKEIIDPGALLAFGAAISSSITMVSIRLLTSTERHHTVLFYYFLIASFLCLPISLYTWKNPTGIEWLYLIGIGVLYYCGQWAFIRAFHHAKPSELGPFCYMAVVYSGFIEWILWGNIPDLLVWIGIALVCIGCIWTIRHSKPTPLKN
ncbi:MAG TPA: EamA family transporter, partial [Chlamydiales bacterium]|nr:EamA family transporter [Chlamydiales bacterium]